MIDFQGMIAIIDEMILKTNCSDMNHFFEIVWIDSREKKVVILHVNDIETIWSD